MTRTRWTDYDWQLIHTEPQSPLMHLALDEVLLNEVAAGRRAPTVRIWEWSAPAIILGIFQSVKNEVDMQAAQRFGVQVVRRISGGGAMFVEPGSAITYSIYAPKALIAGMSFQEAYADMDAFTLEALKTMGIEAWYQPLNDITSADGKIGGAAQAHRGGGVLHHVTMAYDMDADKMVGVLRIGREKLSDKGTKSAKKRVDPLRRQTGLAREVILDRMIETFRQRYGLQAGALTAGELQAANQLIIEKFDTPAWLNKVP
ncbi:MAG TPA: biotin/lipoate A/B protein ligase family protein [Castellaniella sp.]|uniref:lipoate--protein ligase family protein n=1 Tax=Castellaniella sp. TaxID=1955812 RepID=UPI002F099960